MIWLCLEGGIPPLYGILAGRMIIHGMDLAVVYFRTNESQAICCNFCARFSHHHGKSFGGPCLSIAQFALGGWWWCFWHHSIWFRLKDEQQWDGPLLPMDIGNWCECRWLGGRLQRDLGPAEGQSLKSTSVLGLRIHQLKPNHRSSQGSTSAHGETLPQHSGKGSLTIVA